MRGIDQKIIGLEKNLARNFEFGSGLASIQFKKI